MTGRTIYPGADGGIPGEARPENVSALIEAVKKYVKYWWFRVGPRILFL